MVLRAIDGLFEPGKARHGILKRGIVGGCLFFVGGCVFFVRVCLFFVTACLGSMAWAEREIVSERGYDRKGDGLGNRKWEGEGHTGKERRGGV